MKENRDHHSHFEEKLLDELKTVVAQRAAEQELATEAPTPSPGWRRGPRLAFGAAAVCAAAAAVLVFNSGGGHTQKAFAVEQQASGGVAISVYSAEDSTGLEGALTDAGIRSQVTWLPAGMTCREPRFTPSSAKTSGGGTIGGATLAGPGQAMTISVMSPAQWDELWGERTSGEISSDDYYAATGNVSLDPAALRPDQTVVISGSRGPYEGDPEGGFEAQLAIAEGPVEPCDPVEVPAGRSLEEMNRVIESEAAGK
ncbi:MAG TPA: hypothetical protein VHP56_05995 [Solirubrobacterales bacterium]|jgi:hypothetical protein|nr:hypothetical protein [Solirubrobacterales bacterium]